MSLKRLLNPEADEQSVYPVQRALEGWDEDGATIEQAIRDDCCLGIANNH